MKDTQRTLFARLEDDDDTGVKSSYMGAAEYEFGSSHAALKSLTVDFGIPHEVITTNIVIDPKEVELFQPKKKRIAGKLEFAHKRDKELHQKFERMKDGKPLLFRFLPAIADDKKMEMMMGINGFSDVHNNGALFDTYVCAWLTLYPVPGVLYHKSQEKAVNKYIEFYAAKYAADNPDPIELKEKTVKLFLEQNGTYDLVKLASAMEAEGLPTLERINNRHKMITELLIKNDGPQI